MQNKEKEKGEEIKVNIKCIRLNKGVRVVYILRTRCKQIKNK